MQHLQFPSLSFIIDHQKHRYDCNLFLGRKSVFGDRQTIQMIIKSSDYTHQSSGNQASSERQSACFPQTLVRHEASLSTRLPVVFRSSTNSCFWLQQVSDRQTSFYCNLLRQLSNTPVSCEPHILLMATAQTRLNCQHLCLSLQMSGNTINRHELKPSCHFERDKNMSNF